MSTSVEADTAAALQASLRALRDPANEEALGLLRFLNEQVLREQEIFWQRFYSFATLHAGAFVLFSSPVAPHRPLAWAGAVLGVIWSYAQWASLHYANRPKKMYHALRRDLGINWNLGKRGLYARLFGERPWASSTNAGLFTAMFVLGVWVYILSRAV